VAGTLFFINFTQHGGNYAFVISPNGDYSKFYYEDEGDLGGTYGLAINNSGMMAGFIDICQTQGNDHLVGFVATPSNPAPVIDKPTVGAVGTTTALLGATIESTGGYKITAAGIAYGTSQNPISYGKKVSTTLRNKGAFKVTATGLNSNTLYHFQGYVTNSSPQHHPRRIRPSPPLPRPQRRLRQTASPNPVLRQTGQLRRVLQPYKATNSTLRPIRAFPLF
jgi:hypothetical protein